MNYPDDMEILVGRMSDYATIEEDEWSIIKGVMQQRGKYGWVMRSHPTMSEENKQKEQSFLYLEGN